MIPETALPMLFFFVIPLAGYLIYSLFSGKIYLNIIGVADRKSNPWGYWLAFFPYLMALLVLFFFSSAGR